MANSGGLSMKAASKPAILILHTGGTFGMMPVAPTDTLAPSDIQEVLQRFLPELEKIADLSVEVVFNLDSADLQIHHWQCLAEQIFHQLDRYDGFVIIHGTDAMVYTAAALSFMLQNLPKPVVLTGSQRPIAEIRSDARSNLINAVELATHPIPEVGIFFGTSLFRGNRTIKYSTVEFNAFVSPNYPVLASVGLDVKVSHSALLPQPAGPPRLCPAMSQAVQVVRYFPGMPAEPLLRWVDHPVEAVVIEALGLGNVAVRENSLIPAVRALTEAGKVVAISSQCLHGGVDLSRYANGRALLEAGAVGVGDMTTETTIVKLMHLLGCHAGDPQRIRQQLVTPLAGEISPA
ncbi:MAG: asparaginase [Calditrichaeota bacterium]|nr:MAG: asparaginase [Calditrichota bacterium]